MFVLAYITCGNLLTTFKANPVTNDVEYLVKYNMYISIGIIYFTCKYYSNLVLFQTIKIFIVKNSRLSDLVQWCPII